MLKAAIVVHKHVNHHGVALAKSDLDARVAGASTMTWHAWPMTWSFSGPLRHVALLAQTVLCDALSPQTCCLLDALEATPAAWRCATAPSP